MSYTCNLNTHCESSDISLVIVVSIWYLYSPLRRWFCWQYCRRFYWKKVRDCCRCSNWV